LAATFDNIRWLVTLTTDKTKYHVDNSTRDDHRKSDTSTHLSRVSIPAVYVFWAFFLFYIPAMAEGGITIFYLKYKFGWDSDFIGYFLAAEALLLVVSMVVVPEVVKYVRNRPVHDIYWILLGYSTRVLYYMLIPLQKSMNSLLRMMQLRTDLI
jgi:Na+/melibiose symporter-like transporter